MNSESVGRYRRTKKLQYIGHIMLGEIVQGKILTKDRLVQDGTLGYRSYLVASAVNYFYQQSQRLHRRLLTFQLLNKKNFSAASLKFGKKVPPGPEILKFKLSNLFYCEAWHPRRGRMWHRESFKQEDLQMLP